MKDKQQTKNEIEIVKVLDLFLDQCQRSYFDDGAKKKAYEDLFIFNTGLLCGLKLKAEK
jgi:hypothetical protein